MFPTFFQVLLFRSARCKALSISIPIFRSCVLSLRICQRKYNFWMSKLVVIHKSCMKEKFDNMGTRSTFYTKSKSTYWTSIFYSYRNLSLIFTEIQLIVFGMGRTFILKGLTTKTRKYELQKQPFRDVLKKNCSENMQQIYRRTPMPRYDLNKVALQLYWNRTSTWVFSCKFAAVFQNTFT